VKQDQKKNQFEKVNLITLLDAKTESAKSGKGVVSAGHQSLVDLFSREQTRSSRQLEIS